MSEEHELGDIEIWARDKVRSEKEPFHFYKQLLYIGNVITCIQNLDLLQEDKERVLVALRDLAKRKGIEFEDLWDAEDRGYIAFERKKHMEGFLDDFSYKIFGKHISELTPIQRWETQYMLDHFFG